MELTGCQQSQQDISSGKQQELTMQIHSSFRLD
jgi:hypothetical protein